MLFEEQRIFIWKKSQLEDWLLLICRTLLLISAVWAISDPVIRARLPGWLSSARENMVIICDDSASMSAGDEGMTPLDSARIKIADFLRRLGPGYRVAVISGSRGCRLASGFDTPSRTIRTLSDIRPTELGTDLRAALALADRMLQGRASPGVLLVSDFQKTAFGDTTIPLDKLTSGAKVTILPLDRQRDRPNLVWDKVQASAIKGRLSLEARLSNHGQAEAWPVWLEQGGRVLMRLSARLGEDGRLAAGMELPRADSLSLATGNDALAVDNRYYLAGGFAGIRTCLVICQPGGSEYQILSRALAAYSGAGYRPLFSARPTRQDLKQADLVIVASERLLEEAVQLLVQNLGPDRGLILIPPQLADPEDYNRLLSLAGSPTRLASLRTGDLPFRLSLTQEGFLGQASVHQVKVQKYWRISSPAQAEILVGGQDPGLVLERGGLCRLAIVSFGLDPRMSDIAYRPSFLVLLHRLLEFASDCCPRKQFATGDSLRLDRRLKAGLAGPGGQVEGRMEGEAIIWPLEKAGWYRLRLAGREIELAANIPAEESELEPLDSQTQERLFQNLSLSLLKSEVKIPAGRHRAWRFFLALALAFLGLESLFRPGKGAKKQLTSGDNYGKNIG